MLQDNTQILAVDKIVVLKLSTGEEVIGKITDLNAKEVTLYRPHQPGMTQKGMTLMPAVHLGELKGSMVYQRSAIIGHVLEIGSQVLAHYEELISEIKVPPKPSLIVPK